MLKNDAFLAVIDGDQITVTATPFEAWMLFEDALLPHCEDRDEFERALNLAHQIFDKDSRVSYTNIQLELKPVNYFSSNC